MKILVTGGSGYVGSTLVPLLLQEGYHVTVLDNLMYQQNSLLPFFINKNFQLIKGDIRDVSILKNAVKDKDLIVHLAALVGAPACNANPTLAESINYQGTCNLSNIRERQSQPIIFASTGSNYGSINGICTENVPLRPLSVYGETKTKAENYLLEQGNVICYRFATAFGISSRLRLDLLPNDFVFQALRAGNLIVYEKNSRRTFIHVTDMARAILYAIKNFFKMKNEVYNVGDETLNATKEEVALIVKKYINFYLHFAEIGSDPDQRDYEVSYQKIKLTGFKTIISLEEGIKEMVDGFKTIHLNNPYSNVNTKLDS
jgi:nucleoside-diphosphate-sugar epimerase